MKKLLAVLLVLIMTLSFAACGKTTEPAADTADEGSAAATSAPVADTDAAAAAEAAIEPMAFKYACAEGAGSAVVTQLTAAFEKITEYTGGAYTFEVFPDNQLGSITDVEESVFAGAPIIESVGFDQLGDIVNDFMPASFPYVFKDIYEVYDLADSDWMVDMQAKFAEQGVDAIALGANGYRHFISTKPIRSADDIKSMVIRMGPSAAAQGFITVMGGNPTTSTWAIIIPCSRRGRSTPARRTWRPSGTAVSMRSAAI
jgi:TRAP-type C4-dicarboxylate transport system substrate-binding protein